MKILIFRTDIKTKKKVRAVEPLFSKLSPVNRWSVDIEDIDNVLRIETADSLNESDIIRLLNIYGFQCETLAD
ncbi:hypothetical protein WIW50_02945 [Flavobacteriaceae bacterium 3-367]|uniref:hypothetical protein n=1 Tax=Eudoraea algarum TaxID=3417568 RepID=UPI0032836D00